jgi:peptidoglycan-N-acetylmuramic acid deacetylase
MPSFHNTSVLSNESKSWYYNRNSGHDPPTAQRDIDLSLYDSHYLGDTSQKRVYLTFDPGYEIGLTAQILDTLRDKGVPAAFFVTRTYIRDDPELTVRMAEEGHIVANHSSTHPADGLPSLTDEEVFKELSDTAEFYYENIGYTMDPFFRPPAGIYSERTLALTNNMGYTTVFWSFAHVDWIVDDQPTAAETHKKVMNELHNGMIILLHVVSKANTDALPGIIDAIHAEGYEFGTLYELGIQ